MDDIAFATANKVEAALQAVEKVPLNLSYLLEKHSYPTDELADFAQIAVSRNPDVFGITIVMDPEGIEEDSRLPEVYSCRDGEGGTNLMVGLEPHLGLDWYQIPKELGRPVWSEPYYDEGGGEIIMSTYTVPLYRVIGGERKFCGVVAADISLSWLHDVLSRVKVYETGYAFLLSRNGVYITHPNHNLVMRKSIFSQAEDAGNKLMRRLGKEMTRGGTNFSRLNYPFSGKESWIYYTPIPACGWSVGIIFPEEELYAGVRELGKKILFICIGGILVLVVAITFISRSITKPVGRLAASTDEIARGNLDVELPKVLTQDEIGKLAESFSNMRAALKEYIADLKETTAARERMESELKIAGTIQMSFLPKDFSLFPEGNPIEIFAQLQPARGIGGDLYDFFPVEGDRLFFCIGDVSGKGIPAALLMAAAKTLMKGKAGPAVAPSDILASVNRELCSENESMMFVTVFCGILNLRTGEFAYSNAGHLPPLLVSASGSPEWLPVPDGCPLGLFEDAEYETFRCELQTGDTILTYTDGVTEAMDSLDRLYSAERLIEIIHQSSVSGAERMVKEVFRSVEEFSSGLPQADDIAVLAVLLRHFQQ